MSTLAHFVQTRPTKTSSHQLSLHSQLFLTCLNCILNKTKEQLIVFTVHINKNSCVLGFLVILLNFFLCIIDLQASIEYKCEALDSGVSVSFSLSALPHSFEFILEIMDKLVKKNFLSKYWRNTFSLNKKKVSSYQVMFINYDSNNVVISSTWNHWTPCRIITKLL